MYGFAISRIRPERFLRVNDHDSVTRDHEDQPDQQDYASELPFRTSTQQKPSFK
jgi:hypothetical protein